MSALGTAAGVTDPKSVREPPPNASRLTVPRPVGEVSATDAAVWLTDAYADTADAGTPSARGAMTVSQDSSVPFWVARSDGDGDSSP
jgi:hypothetical protein